MPKLIDYPRTTYTSAWEVADVVDDTGGKCALDTCARKLNRKVSGSFKAIVGSAVKFGLLTSKRELLTTTTLFRRIKHAYDKKEEILFHREAFLTPPLFTQLCRKFRQRELPIQMLDVMLIREFGVEEINAPSVAKAFVEGARMVGILDENAIIADIDQLAAQTPPRRELTNPTPAANLFRDEPDTTSASAASAFTPDNFNAGSSGQPSGNNMLEKPIKPVPAPAQRPNAALPPDASGDAVAALFGFTDQSTRLSETDTPSKQPSPRIQAPRAAANDTTPQMQVEKPTAPIRPTSTQQVVEQNLIKGFTITISGPGINTQLLIEDEQDLGLVQGLLEKVRRQLK